MTNSKNNSNVYQKMANATVLIISQKLHVQPKEAAKLFTKSKTYKKLMQGGAYVDHLMPFDFWDMWKNERLTGKVISTVDLNNGMLEHTTLS